MSKVKIIYIFPFKHYYDHNIREKVNRLIYSILTVNANISDNIKIYVDVDAHMILSILFPFNCELINYDFTPSALENKIISSQKKPFLLLNNFEILKLFVDVDEEHIYVLPDAINKPDEKILKEDYGDIYGNIYGGVILNGNSIDYDVTDKYIKKTLKEVYGDNYDKLSNEISNKISFYDKNGLK